MTDSRATYDTRSRILLVDDDDTVRDCLHRILESDGYEVLAASNGPDGLSICRNSIRPIELLVTDYNMPEMTGLELARECSRLCQAMSVLYVSGCVPDAPLQEDLQARQRGFIAKPFRRDELLRKARELLLLKSAA